MNSDLGMQRVLEPFVLLDWRLVADRGLRCYEHVHYNNAFKTMASCEISFLFKSEERNSEAKQQFQQDNSNKQLSYSSATRRAGQFKCAGAIRKAGFLSVKKWILKRRQSIELARKQGWKRYWVCLRGTALLFHSVIETREQLQQHNQNQADSKEQHENRIDLSTWIASNCSGQSNIMAGLLQSEDNQVSLSEKAFLDSMSQCYIEKEPRHLIIIDGAIAQPIPEHPRRDFVFCLSTTFGDAYLFQAGCQLESDNWIAAIHNACAASIARDLVRDEAIKLFETKIKHFELEADKKSFLRHRLESRLTSMSSMCNIGRPNELNYDDATTDLATKSHRASNPPEASAEVPANVDSRKKTMQSLLCQLSQQLLALDSYIEQLHCEIYQLRCYLSSCSDQNMFYHNLATSHQSSSNLALITARHHDLPHPKSLLMHVSKPTKLLLIKLGVFTVSSFHAFIHARQESAKNILHSIQNQSGCPESPIVELRIRSQSMSEALVSRRDNAKLDTETESLIELTNLRTVPIVLSRLLFNKIRHEQGCQQLDLLDIGSSDDCYTIQDCDESIQINIKLNPSSNSSSIIKQVLKILVPNGDEFGFLNYYLQLIIQTATSDTPNSTEQSKLIDEKRKEDFIVVKRKETLADWSNYVYIELLEKIVFRLELARSQMDDDESTAPFGISVEGQLLSSEKDNMLNVYCSYIEWGSVADKAGLKDEDEFLMINGIPVGDLDLMFVECVIQDATKLRAVVRSNRRECPAKSKHLDQLSWRSLDGDGTADGEREAQNSHDFNSNNRTIVSQVITDEYLTSLVCPPPPAKTSAFLRTDTNLLRQKSDLGVDRPANTDVHYQKDHDDELKFTAEVSESSFDLPKSKSHHLIDDPAMVATEICRQANTEIMQDSSGTNLKCVTDLAKQLKQKTEQVTRLLDDDLPVSSMDLNSTCVDHNVERLKKSVLELFETEYAYLRHLETIVEHYMDPLCEISFLNIIDLRSFSQTVFDLLKFQQKFFSTLTKAIFDRLSAGVDKLQEERKFNRDDYDRFNWIVQQIDSFKSLESFVPLLSSIANSFSSEADKFKIYASYCVAYSKLLRILHPKSTASATNFPGASTITSIPNSLNTFVSSSGFRNPSGIGNLTSQHRDTKQSSLIDVLTGPEDRTAHLKQLNEFLSNLDSSSSSASFSLQRSWTSDEHQRSGQSGIGAKPNSEKQSFICPNNRVTGTSNTSNMPYQKNAHHQNFESYLIKPIQRIVKYPMLLNSILLAVQGRSGESIYNDLQIAIKQLEMVISYVNDSQRVHDEFGIVFDQIERQFFEQQALDSNKNSMATIFGPHQPPITLNIMELLYSGPVSWLNAKDFAPKTRKTLSLNSMLFVFKSCAVLICKEQIKVSSKKKNTSKLINETSPNQPIQHQSGGLTSRVLHWSSATTGENVGANEQVCEIVTYQTLIPVSEVQVRTISSDTSGKGTRAAATPADDQDKASLDRNETTSTEFKWELFQCSSSNSNSSLLTKTQCSTKHQPHNHHRNSHSGKVYLLSNSSNEERNSFLRKIRLTIRESVRNMSLPNTTSSKSSLSNKSLVIKKLSISSASSGASNTNICTSTSLSPPESSEGLDPMTQEQSTTIKCEPYEIKRVHETSIEVKT